MTPRDVYRHAKVEHYLDRAQEHLSASRFAAAERMLQAANRLEPANRLCLSLMDELEQLTSILSGRGTDTMGHAEGEKKPTAVVLIVDQDERNLICLTESLRRYGFAVVGAGTYEEAMEALRASEPDVIVSEVNFESGPRGFDLYTHVKTNGFSHDIPFLFMTTRLDRDMLIAGKRFGVDDFLLKPVDPEVVAVSVASSISRHRQHA